MASMSRATTDRRRVVITGMGWVTPLGRDIETAWARLVRGDCAIGPVRRFNAETFSTNFAAQCDDFELIDALGDPMLAERHADASLNGRFALASAYAAWQDAGLHEGAGKESVDPRRVGVYLGAGEGPPQFSSFIRSHIAAWDEQARAVDSVAFAGAAMEILDTVGELEQEPQAAVTHVADLVGARGPSVNCLTACAASTQSVGEAFEIIKRGDAEVMLAGGSHSMIHPLGMTGFIRLTAMSTRSDEPESASRPFDRTRDGFVMGEGAGVVILEDLEHAKARGARIHAELKGYGSTADAYRITDIHPDGGGAQLAMQKALQQAGIDPTKPGKDGRPQVHYISAHGTGTPENDGIETKAVKGVFGDLAAQIPFSSVKSMMGHLIQAAGTVELITCVKAIQSGVVPPTIHLERPDPECDLDYVPNQARDLSDQGGVEVCLSNGFGFGGQNDAVCVQRYVP